MRPSEKQFSYRKLTNEVSVKQKPQRPPQPKLEEQKEDILIDLSSEAGGLKSTSFSSGGSPSKSISLLDEPIDIETDSINGPPPYQQPPSYCNTQTFDPFDTSKVYSSVESRIYLPIPTNGYASTKSDIQLVSSKSVLATTKEVATQPTSLSNDFSLMSMNDCSVDTNSKYVVDSELEKYLLTKQDIPILQPPPSTFKKVETPPTALPKVENGSTFSNFKDVYAKNTNYDTTNVFNKIWYENLLKENGNVRKSHYYDRVADLDKMSVRSFNLYDTCNTDNVYNDTSCNTYAFNTKIRSYSEVPDSVYSEISDNLYSQLPAEVMKPHRPAPPSPMVQSMQQIQRKIQQGQVKQTLLFYSVILLCCYLFS